MLVDYYMEENNANYTDISGAGVIDLSIVSQLMSIDSNCFTK